MSTTFAQWETLAITASRWPTKQFPGWTIWASRLLPGKLIHPANSLALGQASWHTEIGMENSVSTSQEKWDEAKSIVQSLQANLDKGGPLPFKLLEQHQGFLVHLQQIYPVIAPYLKGLQLTLDGWREGRDDDGWKIPGWHPSELPATSPNAPSTVLPVPRLSDDLSTLAALFEPATPP